MDGLGDLIRRIRGEYVASGRAPSYFEINNGLCFDFARDVVDALGGESESLFIVENGNFVVDAEDDPFSSKWDWALLKKHWGIRPPKGFTGPQARGIDFGSHCWITDGRLHYDAECPDGVTSFFDLPLFRRCVVMRLREQGVPADEVVTEDVVPPPVCPVPNPRGPRPVKSGSAAPGVPGAA